MDLRKFMMDLKLFCPCASVIVAVVILRPAGAVTAGAVVAPPVVVGVVPPVVLPAVPAADVSNVKPAIFIPATLAYASISLMI